MRGRQRRWRWILRALLTFAGALVAFACASTRERETFVEGSPALAEGDAGADAVPYCPSNACLPYRLDCNGAVEDGCEANIRADIENCGACGNACAQDGGKAPPYAQPVCLDGGCGYLCVNDFFAGPMRNCANADPMQGHPIQGCPNQLLCDPFNCGECGVVAPLDKTGDRICARGVPLKECPAGQVNCKTGTCGDQCKDLNVDPKNCGECGRECPDPSVSVEDILALLAKNVAYTCNGPNPDGGLPECKAVCKRAYPPEWPELWEDCDGDLEETIADPTNPAFNGCEVNLVGDKDNCGACGKTCQVVCHTKKGSTTAEQICDCPPGLTWCSNPFPGECVDVKNHPLHCGSCDSACPGPLDAGNGTPTCVEGACGYKCRAGYANCNQVAEDGCEVDTQNFPKHCGACGVECMENQRCGNGECQLDICGPGQTR
jgi:hypothetical protein